MYGLAFWECTKKEGFRFTASVPLIIVISAFLSAWLFKAEWRYRIPLDFILIPLMITFYHSLWLLLLEKSLLLRFKSDMP
jgi:RsiW-degrading membrane proteinase PrsW (M82 family)